MALTYAFFLHHSFAAAFGKLIELGIPEAQLPKEKWIMTPTEEQ
jgi:hypothetical protein